MNSITTAGRLDPAAIRFYRHSLQIVADAEIPFLVGGAYAFAQYTGIVRHTKDLDLFVRPADVQRVLNAFTQAGYRTELLFSHWLGKAYQNSDFVDIIFSSGNGFCTVDDGWFKHATTGEIQETTVKLIPVEEMIWQKAYIMERERFDGADVNHLLRACGGRLDWERLLGRFGHHWRVLLAHLLLFGFVYPGDRDSIPAGVLRELVSRLQDGLDGSDHLCMGTLLSRTQYLTDIEAWGYADPRVTPLGPLTEQQVASWTDAGR
jgi:hypothetical protein